MKQIIILLLFPLMTFSQETILVGDVDCNGQINSEDASLILQFVTNVIDTLPCQENMTGLTPEQLQEIINMMNQQLDINYNSNNSNNYPTMISNISLEEISWGDALIYCDELEQNGYSDWFLPNLNQLTYALSGGCELPDERTSNALWTTSIHPNYNTGMISVFESGESQPNSTYWGTYYHCRCIRSGAGETIDNSNESLNTSPSGMLLGLNSEQPIIMIGPMYRYDEFPGFIHFNPIEGSSSSTEYHKMQWLDAILFCSQLDYNGYSDWFLPSVNQIIDYYAKNGAIEIDNFANENYNSAFFWTSSKDTYSNSGPSNISRTTILLHGPNSSSEGWDGINAGEIIANHKIEYISNAETNYKRACFCVR